MHLFLFAASEKSSRAFSKFEIVRMEPRNWEACEKYGVSGVLCALGHLGQSANRDIWCAVYGSPREGVRNTSGFTGMSPPGAPGGGGEARGVPHLGPAPLE